MYVNLLYNVTKKMLAVADGNKRPQSNTHCWRCTDSRPNVHNLFIWKIYGAEISLHV